MDFYQGNKWQIENILPCALKFGLRPWHLMQPIWAVKLWQQGSPKRDTVGWDLKRSIRSFIFIWHWQFCIPSVRRPLFSNIIIISHCLFWGQCRREVLLVQRKPSFTEDQDQNVANSALTFSAPQQGLSNLWMTYVSNSSREEGVGGIPHIQTLCLLKGRQR